VRRAGQPPAVGGQPGLGQLGLGQSCSRRFLISQRRISAKFGLSDVYGIFSVAFINNTILNIVTVKM